MILIISSSNDLHAIAIANSINRRKRAKCAIFPVDQIAESEAISFPISGSASLSVIAQNGRRVRINPRDVSVVWWRRPLSNQALSAGHPPRTKKLIENECRSAFVGTLLAQIRGKWISPPEATNRASNKLLQLQVARQSGFLIPKTVITQSRSDVVKLAKRCGGNVIVKSIVGVDGKMLLTRPLVNPERISARAIATCPAIYQQEISGNTHIRLNAFGKNLYAAKIESNDLDWRPNLRVPVSPWKVPEKIAQNTSTLLTALNLAMGVIDLKISTTGHIYWLEINPQGQFLFLDGLTNMNLVEKFSMFLESESEQYLSRSS